MTAFPVVLISADSNMSPYEARKQRATRPRTNLDQRIEIWRETCGGVEALEVSIFLDLNLASRLGCLENNANGCVDYSRMCILLLPFLASAELTSTTGNILLPQLFSKHYGMCVVDKCPNHVNINTRESHTLIFMALDCRLESHIVLSIWARIILAFSMPLLRTVRSPMAAFQTSSPVRTR